MNFNCNEQISGVSQVNFFLLSETSNWPVQLSDSNSGTIEFNPEVNDVEGEIDDESIEINVTPKSSSEGEIFDISISFRFITRSESLEQLLDQYKNKPGVVTAQLNNGFCKLYGTNEEPLYLNYKVDEGKKTTDNAGTIIEIKGETRNRPLYFTA